MGVMIGQRDLWRGFVGLLVGVAVAAAPASGQALCGDSGGLAYFFNLFPGEDIPSGKCNGNRCAKPQDGSPFIQLSDPLCDPTTGSCAVELGAPFTFPGNQDNIQEFGSQAIEPVIFWFEQETPPPCDPSNIFVSCGQVAICGNGPLITTDRMETFVTVPNISCATVRSSTLVFSLTAFSCPSDRFGCRRATQVSGLTVGYDPFNRRTSVTDPNGVETTTSYDALDRVTFVTQKGAMSAEDLVTQNVYTEFGDLFRTILPIDRLSL